VQDPLRRLAHHIGADVTSREMGLFQRLL
jgi:hypothetical protein